jgi:hypothetical protein
MDFDLGKLADRLRVAADRTAGLKVTLSGFAVIPQQGRPRHE